jgi:hypothetical protein
MKTNYPLDMTPADMADELVEYYLSKVTMQEVWDKYKEDEEVFWHGMAMNNPKAVEKHYFSMIGEHSDD